MGITPLPVIMMWKPPSCTLIILIMCLMKVGEIQAQCERPFVGGNRVIADETSTSTFPEGYTLLFKCSTGYISGSPGTSKTITCTGNQWSELELQCEKKSCGSPGSLMNGFYLTPDGILFGATATAQCNKGYSLVGDKTRNCRETGWDGRNPTCEVVKCMPPQSVENGQFDLKDEYSYNEVLTIECNPGYTLIGESAIVCSDDGQFSPLPPKCLLVECETPKIENAFRVEGKSPPYGYKNFVRYQCKEGFTMRGSDYLVCEVDGWSPPPPTCTNQIPVPATTFPRLNVDQIYAPNTTSPPSHGTYVRPSVLLIAVLSVVVLLGPKMCHSD